MGELNYILNQGEKGSISFMGDSSLNSSRLIYGESAKLFASILKNKLSKGEKYSLLDLGSFKGELLKSLLKLLKGFKFSTIAVDLNEQALKENTAAEKKFVSNLDNLPFKDKSIDVVIMRYVLQWNTPQKQKDIILEIKRVTKKLAIIQHVGADNEFTVIHKSVINKIFAGEVKALKRSQEGMFFSSSNEIEDLMRELKINFEKVDELKINGLSDTAIEKYNLNKEDSKKVKDLLKRGDYLIRTTWVLNFD